MFDALYIGATAMQAQQLNVDTVANNLSNVNTNGYKKGRVSFTDLMTSEAARLGPGAGQGTAPLDPTLSVGAGVGVASLGKLFDQGTNVQTSSPWDIAIQGDGFIAVTQPDGSTAYARGGTLKVNADGLLATRAGQPLKPGLAVPANATAIAIATDGSVSATVPGQSGTVSLGQLQLVRFANSAGLTAQGDGLYRASTDSGEPIAGEAGQAGIGTLQQGFLEGSNVKMVDEMVNLMVAQRAYEASVKVVQASDEMLGMVNNLRK